MLSKVNVTLLKQFLGFYCLYKLIILINHDAFFTLLLFNIVSSLNHFQFPPLMLNKVKVTLLRLFLGFCCLTKHIIMDKSRCFLHIIIISDCFLTESHIVTSVHVK